MYYFLYIFRAYYTLTWLLCVCVCVYGSLCTGQTVECFPQTNPLPFPFLAPIIAVYYGMRGFLVCVCVLYADIPGNARITCMLIDTFSHILSKFFLVCLFSLFQVGSQSPPNSPLTYFPSLPGIVSFSLVYFPSFAFPVTISNTSVILSSKD